MSDAREVMTADQRLLDRAAALKPALHKSVRRPKSEVHVVEDAAAWQGWRCESIGPASVVASRALGRGDAVTFDFGDHAVGRLRVKLAMDGRCWDAPARLRFVFAEVPLELGAPWEPYTGGLGRGWLQDEVVTLDALPELLELPRRYAFSYVRIEVVDTSPAYKIRIADIWLEETGGDLTPITPDTSLPPDLAAIDAVARRTLRNCLHTVFEDGPKRDRRLWVGDLRLQALADAVTFNRADVVARCLYLLGAYQRKSDGLLGVCVYEDPLPDDIFALDYNALYVAALRDHALRPGQLQVAKDLYPVAKAQLDALLAVRTDGILDHTKAPGGWLFIDWCAKLERRAAAHACLIVGLRAGAELAQRLEHSADASRFASEAEAATAAARRWLSKDGLIIEDAQISWATQAWMIIAGVLSPEEGRRAFSALATRKDAVQPVSPYCWHHVVHAYLIAGMDAEALALIRRYWGAMVKAGYSTFPEVFDPSEPLLSPYGTALLNSSCHAWSCTPTWFLRVYRERLLKAEN
ncbi:MAG TPA: hypothetical protein VEJ63_10985 [Planctomycetota bacterium]|nr:hypothetical protein [Planctomycetota bacterium]